MVRAELERLPLPEGLDWSGTNIPPGKKRELLRREAEKYREFHNERDEKLSRLASARSKSANYWHLDRVLIGMGFAAVLNFATMNPDTHTAAETSPPKVIAIGQGDPWASYEPKRMGQSPSLLSPEALNRPSDSSDDDLKLRPPLHFLPKEAKEKGRDLRFLPSDAFEYSISWNRFHLGLARLRGTVKNITRSARVRPYRITLTLGETDQDIDIFADNVDIVSGPGPPRQLEDSTLGDEDRETLRQQIVRGGHRWKRLLYAAEPFTEEINLVPPTIENPRILIYGGSATAAWVWERYHRYARIQGGGDIGDRPYEIYWIARDSFDAARIGERNQETLEHSEEYRYTGELTSVSPMEKDGKRVVSVGFNQMLPIHTFDQIVVAIGREPTQPHGAVDILEDVIEVEGLEPIIEGPVGQGFEIPPGGPPTPIGVRTPGKDDNLRVLGAAGVAVGTSTGDDPVLSGSDREQFLLAIRRLLSRLPVEARVPPGITPAGRTIPLANRPTERDQWKLNINTATVHEMRQVFSRELGDEDTATAIAEETMKYRIGEDDDTQSGPTRYRGFATLQEFGQLDSVTPKIFYELVRTIRV